MVNEEYVIKLIKNKLEMVDTEKKDQIDLLSIANLKDILKRLNDDKEYFNYFLFRNFFLNIFFFTWTY